MCGGTRLTVASPCKPFHGPARLKGSLLCFGAMETGTPFGVRIRYAHYRADANSNPFELCVL